MVVAVALSLVMAVTACRADEPQTVPAPTTPPEPEPAPGQVTAPPAFEVHVIDLEFVPSEIELDPDAVLEPGDDEEDGDAEVDPGQTLMDPMAVRWINRDDVEHTVTFDDLDLGVLPPGGVVQRSFLGLEPGEYPYVCTIHEQMSGTVIVLG